MTPRWKRFLWQGAALALIGIAAAGVGDGPLAAVVLTIAAMLILAGLIGGAVRRDDEAPQ